LSTQNFTIWSIERLPAPSVARTMSWYVSPLPRDCHREFLGFFTATVATPETGFVKSKPRRIEG
jgi:hypothetical protein